MASIWRIMLSSCPVQAGESVPHMLKQTSFGCQFLVCP